MSLTCLYTVCCSHTPCPLSTGPLLTQPLSWKALEPRAIGRNMEIQTEVDTRDHSVALVSLIPCPRDPFQQGCWGVPLIQGPTIV